VPKTPACFACQVLLLRTPLLVAVLYYATSDELLLMIAAG
jgi:hypothetical protein